MSVSASFKCGRRETRTPKAHHPAVFKTVSSSSRVPSIGYFLQVQPTWSYTIFTCILLYPDGLGDPRQLRLLGIIGLRASSLRMMFERVRRVELRHSPWKGDTLPLHYARMGWASWHDCPTHQ